MDEDLTREVAMALLQAMATIGQAAVAGGPRAKAYLDADAIRIVDGKPQFHKDRFLAVLADDLVLRGPMNPVLLLVRDNFEMNKRAIDSIFAQDIPATLVIVDNSVRDDTFNWALEQKIAVYPFRPQLGVSKGWNFGLAALFKDGWEHVLVPNSDTILPPWFYRELLAREVDFVTGVSVESMEQIAHLPNEPQALVEAPDFSAFLIRREAWQKVGPFDERMKNYYSDNDWHIRAHRAGVPLWNAGLPFYHERSSTLKNAPPREKRDLDLQSVADSEVFYSIYGCYPWQPEYAALFRKAETERASL